MTIGSDIYYRERPNIRTGDMLEWRGRSVLARAIRYFTGKQANHTSVTMWLTEFKGLQDRRFTIEALAHGLELNLLSERLANYNGIVWWYRLKKEYDALREQMGAFAITKLGQRIGYDYGGALRNAVCRVSVNARAYYCTEYVQAIYTNIGLLDDKLKALRPGEIEEYGLHERPVMIYHGDGKTT